MSADGTKRIVTKKVAGGLVTKIRVKKVTSPGRANHLRKVPYPEKKVVAMKKD